MTVHKKSLKHTSSCAPGVTRTGDITYGARAVQGARMCARLTAAAVLDHVSAIPCLAHSSSLSSQRLHPHGISMLPVATGEQQAHAQVRRPAMGRSSHVTEQLHICIQVRS